MDDEDNVVEAPIEVVVDEQVEAEQSEEEVSSVEEEGHEDDLEKTEGEDTVRSDFDIGNEQTEELINQVYFKKFRPFKPENINPDHEEDIRRKKAKLAELCASYYEPQPIKRPYERLVESFDHEISNLRKIGDEIKLNLRMEQQVRDKERLDVKREEYDKMFTMNSRQMQEHMARFNLIQAQWTELGFKQQPKHEKERTSQEVVREDNKVVDGEEEGDKDKEEEEEDSSLPNLHPAQYLAKITTFKQQLVELERQKDELYAEVRKKYQQLVLQSEIERQDQCKSLHNFIERLKSQNEIEQQVYDNQLLLLEKTLYSEYMDLFNSTKVEFRQHLKKLRKDYKCLNEILEETSRFYIQKIEEVKKKEVDITSQIQKIIAIGYNQIEADFVKMKRNASCTNVKTLYQVDLLKTLNPELDIVLNDYRRSTSTVKNKYFHLKKELSVKKHRHAQMLMRKKATVDDLHKRLAMEEAQHQQKLLKEYHTFLKAWQMYYDEIMVAIHDTLLVEKSISETALYVNWPGNEAYKRLTLNQPFICPKKKKHHRSSAEKAKGYAASKERVIRSRLFRNILRLIPCQTSSMMSATILNLIKPYSKESQDLVSIDQFINLIQVTSMDEMDVLVQFFQDYASEPILTPDPNQANLPPPRCVKSKFATHRPKKPDLNGPVEPKVNAKNIANLENLLLKPQMIPVAVLKYIQNRENEEILAHEPDCPIVYTTLEEIKNFFKPFYEILPKDLETIWAILRHAMQHYRAHLKKREALVNRCDFLKKQNKELRHLLREYNK